MLSRLIVTFLCAAAIGSVSGAFMTFDPDQLIVRDIEETISFSAKLNSKPSEEVTMYFEHPFMFMSDCMIVFNPDNWDVPQQLTAIPAPLFVGSSNPPKELASNTEFLAKAVTVGPLPAELSFVDTLKVIQKNLGVSSCSIKKSEVDTFDEMLFSFNKPGWYEMASTGDITIQVFMDKCTAELSCIKKVLARYGTSVMGMDVSGPVKDISEYSPTYVTQNTNRLRYRRNSDGNEHKIVFPYGSELYFKVLNNDGIMSLDVYLDLVAGYSLSRGLCNIPRPLSLRNMLVGSNGKLYNLANKDEVAAFSNSWKVKDEDVLTNPRARTLIPPTQQPGTVCKFPETHRQNL
ncbi:hypothetical protein BASA50_007599 [Batrachochytrium salamandrivorans]|uniref:VWFD domain-containing protein n=1 Tax=Batrachochytrium salamandrivorans TaxID=1357716 RepID=A0ABQ8F6G6_9FUNG|nr:hypothetical protein BASA61_008560 [Batrachochytrium salamandrivorans]KAH6593078.1 hypothetical protein BASA50_007599 [Batrachochytrium salamandrivorans]